MNNPPKAAVVYFSQHGMTGLLASHIAEGAASAGCDVELCRIAPDTIVEGRYHNAALFDTLNQCDAIIFGSPTCMGSPSAQFKAFMDASCDCYSNKAWKDKLAGGFTTGGSINGEQQQTLLAFITLACQHGMLWAGLDTSQFTDSSGLNRTGSSLGLVASPDEQGNVHPNDLKTAFYYGQRLAALLMLPAKHGTLFRRKKVE
ncbi:flavodoxin family protein [Vibrio sp. V39_P1S14PM300]|uniref:flavodoxin family protein n=1 Tax=Vibrio sp. V39_P1S14PM300 TaxID=1938690 RepID=UPI00137258CE|nr:flavodoxin family protein [Vibrio sp. V39_P1S14PM300]NAX19938.1 flavodoxin family protein [Vibrio sp. V39_P1S14PM300]